MHTSLRNRIISTELNQARRNLVLCFTDPRKESETTKQAGRKEKERAKQRLDYGKSVTIANYRGFL